MMKPSPHPFSLRIHPTSQMLERGELKNIHKPYTNLKYNILHLIILEVMEP